jgi:hypothetical protein
MVTKINDEYSIIAITKISTGTQIVDVGNLHDYPEISHISKKLDNIFTGIIQSYAKQYGKTVSNLKVGFLTKEGDLFLACYLENSGQSDIFPDKLQELRNLFSLTIENARKICDYYKTVSDSGKTSVVNHTSSTGIQADAVSFDGSEVIHSSDESAIELANRLINSKDIDFTKNPIEIGDKIVHLPKPETSATSKK